MFCRFWRSPLAFSKLCLLKPLPQKLCFWGEAPVQVMGWCTSVSYSGVRAFMRCLTPWDFMTHIFQSRMFRAVVAASVSALALTGVAWANRSSDLQQKISELTSRASQCVA
jgi:hypothetical protein